MHTESGNIAIYGFLVKLSNLTEFVEMTKSFGTNA